MADQEKKLAQSLTVVARSLDDPQSLLPALTPLGSRHTAYGVENRHSDSVSQALLAALGETLGADYSPAVHDAWAGAYTQVAAVMKRALTRSDPGAETLR